MNFERLLQQAAKALVDLDAEALAAHYAPEFLLEDIASGNRITDKTELRAYYDRLFSTPEIAFENVNFFSMGERAAGEWTWCGINSSGIKFSIRGASLFIMGEDGIREEILFYDPGPASE
ncbi:MAG: nuclear transport factor 2 family protein [Anaerolineales bacterium]|nr:nuclear transport factor 2 family protein [Anaerolineales bacterium]